MRHVMIFQSSLFAALVLGVAAAAGSRMVPFDAPPGADWFDGRLARAFESHYDERFPGRTLATNTWAAMDYLLFDEGRPGVVVGREGWLYTEEEFKAYPEGADTVATHLALVPWVRDQLARQGTQLVVALVPSKARIYPEFLGARHPAALHAGLYGHARATLRASGIVAPDLEAALAACKRRTPAFLRTDTHWTPAGARCAADAVRAAAGFSGQARYRTRTESVEVLHGDLLSFLPLAPYFSSLLPPPEQIDVRRTERVAGASDPAQALLGEAAAPPVVLVGTSYSADPRWNLTGALQEALRDDVINYAAKGQGPFLPMLDFLMNAGDLPAPPRLVVWEIPERYLPMAQDLRVERGAPACGAADPDQTL